MDFSEQIIECDELRKTICKRAEEIIKIAIIEAPNSFRVSNRFKQFSDCTQLESFHIRNGVIHFKHYWYIATAMNLYDEFIPVKWFDMTDEDLVTLFHDMENKWEENNKKTAQQKEVEEKEKRRQEYLKLKRSLNMLKVFKIKNPDASYEDTVEMVVCAESIEDVRNRLTYHGDNHTTEVTGFNNNDEYFLRFFGRHPDELIIEEVILDEPKIICVDFWEG